MNNHWLKFILLTSNILFDPGKADGDPLFFVSGIHEITWNGKDSAGQSVPAGSYIIQLVSSDGIHSRPVIKVN